MIRSFRRAGWFAAGLFCLMAVATSAAVPAQQAVAEPNGVRFGDEHTERYRVGMVVSAASGPCRNISGTIPFPIEWPEQHVKIVSEDISPSVRNVEYRDLDSGVRQMLVQIPYLAAGEEARAVVTLEVTRRALLPPEDTEQFVIPEKMDRTVRVYLGPSPGIESRQAKIRTIAKDLKKQHGDEPAWKHVEAIYDWVREHVTYQEGKFKGAMGAFKDKKGDCEDMSSLFIAICRASNIPARTVWVPGHCYPEFYLADAEGKGHWFPCQAAGTKAFGEMPEKRPILQKGDNFAVPERSDRQRYVAEHLTGGGGKPSVKFIRESGLAPN